jgi:hypothetical protein
VTRRPTPTRPPRTPPARLSDAELEDALRRAFATDDDPELWVVPTALLAKIARAAKERKEAQQTTGP